MAEREVLATVEGHGHTCTAYAEDGPLYIECTCGRTANIATRRDKMAAEAERHIASHRARTADELLADLWNTR